MIWLLILAELKNIDTQKITGVHEIFILFTQFIINNLFATSINTIDALCYGII